MGSSTPRSSRVTKEQRAPEEVQWRTWREALLIKVCACLDAIDSIAPDLVVHQPTISEITIGCALGYLDFRSPELEWRSRHRNAARWNEEFQTLPAMQATRPHEG